MPTCGRDADRFKAGYEHSSAIYKHNIKHDSLSGGECPSRTCSSPTRHKAKAVGTEVQEDWVEAGTEAEAMVEAGTEAEVMVEAGMEAEVMAEAGTEEGDSVAVGTEAEVMAEVGKVLEATGEVESNRPCVHPQAFIVILNPKTKPRAIKQGLSNQTCPSSCTNGS